MCKYFLEIDITLISKTMNQKQSQLNDVFDEVCTFNNNKKIPLLFDLNIVREMFSLVKQVLPVHNT